MRYKPRFNDNFFEKKFETSSLKVAYAILREFIYIQN